LEFNLNFHNNCDTSRRGDSGKRICSIVVYSIKFVLQNSEDLCFPAWCCCQISTLYKHTYITAVDPWCLPQSLSEWKGLKYVVMVMGFGEWISQVKFTVQWNSMSHIFNQRIEGVAYMCTASSPVTSTIEGIEGIFSHGICVCSQPHDWRLRFQIRYFSFFFYIKVIKICI
jgi:hypothetical protein